VSLNCRNHPLIEVCVIFFEVGVGGRERENLSCWRF